MPPRDRDLEALAALVCYQYLEGSWTGFRGAADALWVELYARDWRMSADHSRLDPPPEFKEKPA